MDTTTDLRIEGGDARRLRFRDAITTLSTRARSGDLLRMVLLPASALTVGGFAVMLLGWWGAAHTHRQIEQIPYLISGGLIGLAMVIVGALLLATAIWLAQVQRLHHQADERARSQLAELLASIATPATAPRSSPRRTKRLEADR